MRNEIYKENFRTLYKIKEMSWCYFFLPNITNYVKCVVIITESDSSQTLRSVYFVKITHENNDINNM